MNKTQFMNALAYAVRDLPGPMQESLLWDYETKFIQAMHKGDDEAHIANRFAHPHLIARHARMQHKLSQLQGHFSVRTFVSYSFRVLAMLWLNVLMLAPMLVYLLFLACASLLALIVNCAGIAVIYFALTGTTQLVLTVPATVSVTDVESVSVDTVPRIDWSRHGLSWQNYSGVSPKRNGLLLVNLHFIKNDIWYGLQLVLLGMLLSTLSWYWGRFSWYGLKRFGRWQWRQLHYPGVQPTQA